MIFFPGQSCGNKHGKGIEPVGLKCEYRVNPLCIESFKPRLSWILKSEVRNQYQSAYRILVSSSKTSIEKNIGDLWESHKINSVQYNCNCLYPG